MTASNTFVNNEIGHKNSNEKYLFYKIILKHYSLEVKKNVILLPFVVLIQNYTFISLRSSHAFYGIINEQIKMKYRI